MSKHIIIDKKIDSFKKKIFVSGDKSLSIRWALLASQATGRSKALNLLRSEDVINTLKSLKKLGVKVTTKKNYTEIVGNGINIEGSLKLIKSTIVPAPALHIAKLALASISSTFRKIPFGFSFSSSLYCDK